MGITMQIWYVVQIGVAHYALYGCGGKNYP